MIPFRKSTNDCISSFPVNELLCLLCLLCVRYINLFVTQMLILLSGKEWMRDAEHKNCLFVVQRAEYWRVW
ncbi:Uncharacterised protein [Vibrio cholerae]|uniref:Uncharacterized protein n=1 Tax=Vibrio cholerae TaxID=666 RepID=A0A655XU41_VIBCL|nr:Uncharacterised protein [Vibrio cholerae]CSB84513.1 Uncharacterised protein [Vibrio cholerae]CSC20998.1 Uncharacterised protein [Vibrio cholerae]CSC46783.1 Uncharacterised protein [Vibrio cholerae]CSD02547.1 Uncharacterised protein [Vibrio cholerae]